jgi:2-keto-4-pentenoate hydratase/2-oxohepta-3-ene-1,7-dioic acid hydratase in catechol pathway
MIFNVDDVLVHLSTLFRLRAGDVVYMGTPAGVAALQRGDRFRAVLEGVAELSGEIV